MACPGRWLWESVARQGDNSTAGDEESVSGRKGMGWGTRDDQDAPKDPEQPFQIRQQDANLSTMNSVVVFKSLSRAQLLQSLGL